MSESGNVQDSALTSVNAPAAQAASDLGGGEAVHESRAVRGSERGGAGDGTADRMLSRIGQLARSLHDDLRNLGYDHLLERVASAIPDARDRLAYIAVMTEQAAERSLNATEVAKPIQDGLATGAAALSRRWHAWKTDGCVADKNDIVFNNLVSQTRAYLKDVPRRTDATNAQLLEIMMAQDFQDLTGQVIKKITEMVQNLERELVQLLVDSVPPEKQAECNFGLMNGPVVRPEGRNDVVTSQDQVDDLLATMGF